VINGEGSKSKDLATGFVVGLMTIPLVNLWFAWQGLRGLGDFGTGFQNGCQQSTSIPIAQRAGCVVRGAWEVLPKSKTPSNNTNTAP